MTFSTIKEQLALWNNSLGSKWESGGNDNLTKQSPYNLAKVMLPVHSQQLLPCLLYWRLQIRKMSSSRCQNWARIALDIGNLIFHGSHRNTPERQRVLRNPGDQLIIRVGAGLGSWNAGKKKLEILNMECGKEGPGPTIAWNMPAKLWIQKSTILFPLGYYRQVSRITCFSIQRNEEWMSE